MSLQTQVTASHQPTVEPPTPERHAARLLPTYDELIRDNVVLQQVEEINKFSFTVFYQNNGALVREDVVEAVLAAVLRNLTDALTNTGIHHLQFVEATAQRAPRPGARLDGTKAVASITMQHSVFQFGIRVFDDRFVITRDSSSFRDFYAWYRAFMPNATQLEATVRQAVGRRFDQPLDITQTQFEFKFVFSDFEKENWREKRGPRNVDVLSKILPTVPNPAGPTALSKQDFTRLDLTLSRLEQFNNSGTAKLRNCWYMLEAPSNERSRFIIFTAQLRNASVEQLSAPADSGEIAMVPFDPDFSEDYFYAVTDFLKARALDDFMGTLLEDWKFGTQRQL